jgi:hypothetical protein
VESLQFIFFSTLKSSHFAHSQMRIVEAKLAKRPTNRFFFPRFAWISFLFGGSADQADMAEKVAEQQQPHVANALVPQVTDQNDRLPQVNEIIISDKTHKKYRLVSILGSGGYVSFLRFLHSFTSLFQGTVFEATDDSRKLAIKTEKYSKSMLRIEANVLKLATQMRCTRIAEFIEYVSFKIHSSLILLFQGYVKPNYCYLVMPLLGRDLSSLRNEQKDHHFQRQTIVRVGILTVQVRF